MLVITPFIDSFREFHTKLSDYTKYLIVNPRSILKQEFFEFKSDNTDVTLSYQNYSAIINFSVNTSSVCKNTDIDEIIFYIKKDGFSLGINLPEELVRQICEFAMNAPCYGNGEENLGFYYRDKEQAQLKYGDSFSTGRYYNTALQCLAIKKLETDPTLLEIAAKYLGAEPVHQGNQLGWHFPIESTIYQRRREAQRFHYHLDGYRSLRFLFYITDVDLCSSPHVCVRGSHIKKKLSHQFLSKGCSHPEIREYYGYENIVPICGKAGLGFGEDPRSFHKESSPGSKERLTLQIQFATKDYGIQNDVRQASQLSLFYESGEEK